jgi:predicted Zn-dependent protease
MKIKRLITTCFLTVSMLLVGVNVKPAFAMTPVEYGNLTWSIDSIYYYLTSSVNSFYVTPIKNAAQNWYYPGWTNKLSPNARTYTQSSSAIDFHAYNSNDGNAGITTFWVGSGTQVNPNAQNWTWCKINLNSTYNSLRYPTEVQATIAHEMGHVFGLDEDYNNSYSIMYYAADLMNVTTVQKVDNDAFNYKHP